MEVIVRLLESSFKFWSLAMPVWSVIMLSMFEKSIYKILYHFTCITIISLYFWINIVDKHFIILNMITSLVGLIYILVLIRAHKLEKKRKHEIETTIITKALINSNKHLYRFEEAHELVNLCQEQSMPILCINSFIVIESISNPFLEHCFNYKHSENSHEAAKTFLENKKNSDYYFEVVY